MRFFISYSILLLTLAILARIFLSRKQYTVKIPDKVFVLAIFLLMIIPASYIHNKTVNKWENRNFYTAPALLTTAGINPFFGKEFEKYFDDRIVGRKDLLKVHNFLHKINRKQKNEKVLFGLDNWLFYKFDNSIANYKNEALFSEQELRLILKNLTYIKSFNRNFYLFIAPDKNKIYGEFFPKEIIKTNPDNQSRARQLAEYITKNSDIPVIYPYQALHKAKQNKELLYYKQGTHWNQLGAEIGFIELLKTINKKHPDICYRKAIKLIDSTYRDTDLAESIPYFKNPDQTTYKQPASYNNCQKKSLFSTILF